MKATTTKYSPLVTDFIKEKYMEALENIIANIRENTVQSIKNFISSPEEGKYQGMPESIIPPSESDIQTGFEHVKNTSLVFPVITSYLSSHMDALF